MKKLFIACFLFIAATSNAITIQPVASNFTQSISDGYVIVSKLSGRSLTRSAISAQITQTQSFTSVLDEVEIIAPATDVCIAYFGTVTNPNGFSPGTYPVYKLQWGRMNPYTLNNSFWDVKENWKTDGTPVISWPSTANAPTDPNNNQYFIIEPTGSPDSSVYIRSLASGKCLQIAGNATANLQSGAGLELATKYNAPNQKFLILRPGNLFRSLPLPWHPISKTAKLENVLEPSAISIYPNPSKATINISGLPAATEYFEAGILDITGKSVRKFKSRKGAEINISDLPPGIYVLHIASGQLPADIKTKFVKQ